ncbi:MAG TPA: M24 family metallopeptidase [Pseudonocardiaceae bacterium]|nr:M24 family metallopeptidase [Pseudonocardiaceae bacterium]
MQSIAILDQEYPRFSDTELVTRHQRVTDMLAEAGRDHLLVWGANRAGSGVQWLTRWPVTAEAAAIVTPGRIDALFVQHHNHLPQARRLATEAEVGWQPSTIHAALDELERRGARPDSVAYIGPLGVPPWQAMAKRFGEPLNLNREYTRLRQIKSAEEIAWLRLGAHFTDLGMSALRDNLRPGLTERELGDMVERAYVAHGAINGIHYFGVTPMDTPSIGVPSQFPSARRVQPRDVVFAEITAIFWDYPGQVLRTFTLGEPTARYRELHAVADAAFDAILSVLRDGVTPAEIVAAAGVIEEAGCTTIDDLLHGYGGGYLPPVLGSASRPAGPLPTEPLRAGMTVVVQPNVTTLDGTAGVQTGELVMITGTGAESLHNQPRGLTVLG